jgi:hypothetical protein
MGKYSLTILTLVFIGIGILLQSEVLHLGIGNCNASCSEGLACAAVIIDCDRYIGSGMMIICGLLLIFQLIAIRRNKFNKTSR